MLLALAVIAALFLAFANGANDNAKGVATLVAGKTLALDRALQYAAATTFLGSVTAVVFAQRLIKLFSGKGIVSDDVTQTTAFVACVAVAAAATVLIATRIGLPISTTHAMVGGISGVGFSAGALHVPAVIDSFLIPLLASPVMALAATATLYVLLRWARLQFGVGRETCVCIEERFYPAAATGDPTVLAVSTGLGLVTRPVSECRERYHGSVAGVEAQRLLDWSHIFSGGLISFARGLNDTPKIAALLVAVGALAPGGANTSVGVAIAVGGLVAVHRVARLLSYCVTEMNDGQAFTGNLVTAFGVILASRLGLPVSTTHVSCGSLFGIGLVNGRAHWNVIGRIVLAWIVTLPFAATVGWAMWKGLGN